MKYLENAEDVSNVVKNGLTFFDSNPYRVILGTEKGKYVTNPDNVRELEPNYGSGRTLGEITGGNFGLGLLLPERPGKPERLQESASSYKKDHSN